MRASPAESKKAPAHLDAVAVAELLDEMALRLEMAGVSKFKVRAYETAAANLRTLFEPLDRIVRKKKLTTIPGVGNAIAEKIEAMHFTGSHPSLDQLRQQGPAGLLQLMRIPGVGPQRAKDLYDKLHITNREELRAACESGLLAKTKGFGKSIQAKILASLDAPQDEAGLIRLNRASARAAVIEESIRERYPQLADVVATGDLRRACEVCHGITFAASGPDDLLRQAHDDSNPFLMLSPRESFGAALLFATGSAPHVAALVARAASLGLLLTAKGLMRGNELLPSATEEQIYAALGMPFIEPELREGRGEVERALAGTLPDLVKLSDLRGVLHCHTDFSDGIDTLEAMAGAAAERGLEYFGVCDHSPSAFYAGGLKIEDVREQQALADELNARGDQKCFIFKGIESDIQKDGALDFAPQDLASFDFIVASVHGRFKLSADEQTARILAAVRNPFTTILGHPTGRLLLSRKGYDVDMDEILKTCGEHGVAVEINGDPHRLDLDWRWHRRAVELGCMLSINPDAHDTLALSYLKWGTLMARKGGVSKQHILNCLPLEEIRKHFERRRAMAIRQLS